MTCFQYDNQNTMMSRRQVVAADGNRLSLPVLQGSICFETGSNRQHQRVKIHFLLAPAGPKILKAQ
jgi:hypothetical protein